MNARHPLAKASSSPLSLTVAKRRCAIYTRKSSEEGLDQEYNSLEAQRDAALSFVASQRHEGWIALDGSYDDGGYSGGNMERPALKRLLTDIEAGQIDVIVVYKIDRLSRSLGDFARMVDLFDAKGVTFVSVTQQFNTTTSMGRLTLNILLSFAQFEREVTGERIRDKIAASKAKGMWMGGVPPLGYDVKERKLIANPAEAALVQDIFRRYAEHGSAARLVRELEIEGRTTKAWVNQSGQRRAGKPMDQQYLFKLLRNRIYLGEIGNNGHFYPGQHEAIIDNVVWQAVHAHIRTRKQGPRERRSEHPALLAGLLYAPDGQRMLPTYTAKPNGKRYRYYVPYLHKRKAAPGKHAKTSPSNPTDAIGALPAAEIEAAVLRQIHAMLRKPEMVVAVCQSVQSSSDQENQGSASLPDEAQITVALQQMESVWDKLFAQEQQRIARLLIERVQLQAGGLEIVWKEAGWQALARQMQAEPLVREAQQAENGVVA